MAELTTGALSFVFGVALSVIGIAFFLFICVGVPLVLVGIILILAEGGQITKPMAPRSSAYAPPYPSTPYPPCHCPPRPRRGSASIAGAR